MIAYKVYERDPKDGYELIAVMPERRHDPTRITRESIKNLGKAIIGENPGADNLFFHQVVIDENTGKVLRANPAFDVVS